jgi:hypothetical protein
MHCFGLEVRQNIMVQEIVMEEPACFMAGRKQRET